VKSTSFLGLKAKVQPTPTVRDYTLRPRSRYRENDDGRFRLVDVAIFGQSLPERQQGLRVALAITAPNADSKATKTSGELRTIITRELEKLGDVRVTSLSETYDERLEVIVAGGGVRGCSS
jgi:hypothetical protein